MATEFSVIRDFARAAIGDFGIRDEQGDVVTLSKDFHNDDIDSVIALKMKRFPNHSVNASEISPTLTSNEEGAIAYWVALCLALPAGTFSIDAPNMKYWAQANLELISHLLGELKYYLDSGDIGPSIWGTLDQYYNEGQLIVDRVSEAVGAV